VSLKLAMLYNGISAAGEMRGIVIPGARSVEDNSNLTGLKITRDFVHIILIFLITHIKSEI